MPLPSNWYDFFCPFTNRGNKNKHVKTAAKVFINRFVYYEVNDLRCYKQVKCYKMTFCSALSAAIVKNTPHIASAMNMLVFSGSICVAAATRGRCRKITQNKNIKPSSVQASRVFILMRMLMQASENATPIK